MGTSLLPLLLGIATLLPLGSFFVILLTARYLARPILGGYIAIGAIVTSGVLSFTAMGIWLTAHPPGPESGHHSPGTSHVGSEGGSPQEGPQGPVARRTDVQEPAGTPAAGPEAEHAATPMAYTGEYYLLARAGKLRLTIGYYIDSLTIAMFCMVTFIASCIHFYSLGYMHEEEHEVTDHEVTLSDGGHLHRPGRFARFFQYLSLFSFSMLGLVLAGNLAMVFVFWELVGICSYFLIGFYIERKSASTAANKAFIVNRIGDFGMLVGMMILWSTLGTFSFGDVDANRDGQIGRSEQGIFSLVRPEANNHRLTIPDGMIAADEQAAVLQIVRDAGPAAAPEAVQAAIDSHIANVRATRGVDARPGPGYWLLVLAGIGIFCGCVGKSAQFPLHVWLPDAMEGPTPVSALVHSATMVAAGVYLVSRFYPVFAPETLLVVATIGCITLFLAATIAITATDIKRVLAYSTVSQLGYMMLGLGVGGWLAGVMHLITHAFFKSLLFLCSGSVIHAVHTNDMRFMGGLRKKMPITAYTMLVGCLAISGISIPFVVGFSGYYSKDSILEQSFSLFKWDTNISVLAPIFFAAAAGGAAITAFYMFRLWYMTFAGEPRDHHRYDHAHEAPRSMFLPLVVLAIMATCVAWRPDEALLVATGMAVIALLAVAAGRWMAWESLPRWVGTVRRLAAVAAAGVAVAALLVAWYLGTTMDPSSAGWLAHIWLGLRADQSLLVQLLEQSRPAGTAVTQAAAWLGMTWPSEHYTHAQHATIVVPVTLLATATSLGGIALATVMYCWGYLQPGEVRRQFEAIYRFLWNKWWFDELYDALFVRPTLLIARLVSGIDRSWIDALIDSLGRGTVAFARFWDRVTDRTLVDGSVNLFAAWIFSLGISLHRLQTGRLRQYVMFIVVGLIAVFLLVSLLWTTGMAR